MISIPSTWRASYDKGRLLMEHSSGAVIRYVERFRPVRALNELIELCLNGSEILEIEAPVLLTTDEGEYATRLDATVETEGGLEWCSLGFVWVDDFVAILDARTTQEDHARELCELACELLKSDVHLLWNRRRPYLYDGPPGWQARQFPHRDEWQTLDGREIAITAFHAVPKAAGYTADSAALAIFHHDARSDYQLVSGVPEREVQNAHGLTGSMIGTTGYLPDWPRIERIVAVLEDANFVYMLRLETTDSLTNNDIAVFERVLASIEPIPRRRSAAADSDVFSNWAA